MVYPGFGRPFRATHLGLCRDRPCGALYYLLWLTQGLVALSGLRTLGFVGVAPIGAYPSRWSKAAVRSASASIRWCKATVRSASASVLLGRPMPYSILMPSSSASRPEPKPPAGLCIICCGLPRVWSPLQGCAPWALLGSPQQGSVSFAVAYPGFGRPFRATHPGLCRDRPYRGLHGPFPQRGPFIPGSAG